MCISYLQVSLLVLTGDRLVLELRFEEELLLSFGSCILFVGGYDNNKNTVQVYDGGSWNRLPRDSQQWSH
jgi:hypothetical protein